MRTSLSRNVTLYNEGDDIQWHAPITIKGVEMETKDFNLNTINHEMVKKLEGCLDDTGHPLFR